LFHSQDGVDDVLLLREISLHSLHWTEQLSASFW